MNESKPEGGRKSRHRRPAAMAVVIVHAEVRRQFKLSFALTIAVTVATLAVVATMPVAGWKSGYRLNGSTELMAIPPLRLPMTL